MKYQLNVSKSTDEIMVFYDLHTVEVEKDGQIEVTMYKATAKGEMLEKCGSREFWISGIRENLLFLVSNHRKKPAKGVTSD